MNSKTSMLWHSRTAIIYGNAPYLAVSQKYLCCESNNKLWLWSSSHPGDLRAMRPSELQLSTSFNNACKKNQQKTNSKGSYFIILFLFYKSDDRRIVLLQGFLILSILQWPQMLEHWLITVHLVNGCLFVSSPASWIPTIFINCREDSRDQKSQ